MTVIIFFIVCLIWQGVKEAMRPAKIPRVSFPPPPPRNPYGDSFGGSRPRNVTIRAACGCWYREETGKVFRPCAAHVAMYEIQKYQD